MNDIVRWSTLPVATQKDAGDIDSLSHKLLQRGGFIQPVMAGVFAYLPFGLRVLRKIENIVRQEMQNVLGFNEVLLPALHPLNLWQKTGRDEAMKDILYRVGEKAVLGPTHEEVVSSLNSRLLSWKQLPYGVFQIQTKFRNEPRPQFGLLRTREFVMKDAYSFHADQSSLTETYEKVSTSYSNILNAMQLEHTVVQADSGAIGGSESREFLVGDIEVGHVFQLGTKYTQIFECEFSDAQNKRQNTLMGCYGIGISRLVAAVVEKHNDVKGIAWPQAVSPFDAIIICTSDDQIQVDVAKSIAVQMSNRNVLIDDRSYRPGVKFNDAELIGIPWQIVIGRDVNDGKVELRRRLGTSAKVGIFSDWNELTNA